MTAPPTSADRAPRRAGWRSVRSQTALVLAVWIVTRVWALASGLEHLPYPRNDILYSDVGLYVQWSESIANGVFPFKDEMWQYPPLAGLVFVSARLWPWGAYQGFIAIAVLTDLLVMWLILRAARRQDRFTGAWVWALTAAIVGPIMFGRFDVIPTLFAVAAVVAVTRPAWSGVWAAIGTMLKVWPVLVLAALPRRSLPRALTAFVVTGVVSLAVLLSWSGGGLSFLGFQRSRGLQMESVAALPFHLLHLIGRPMPNVYRYGSIELDVAGAGPAAAVATLLGLVLLGWLGVSRLQGRLERVPPGDVALTAVLISVATSRVFSPQYAVWLLGLAALAVTDPRTRLRAVVPLVALGALLSQLIYPLWYGDLMDGSWFAVLFQTGRILALVAACWLAVARVLWRPARAYPEPTAQAGTSPPVAATRAR